MGSFLFFSFFFFIVSLNISDLITFFIF